MSRPENVRTYLDLARLLDGIHKDHPEVSAPLRLTLLRARRDGDLGALDEGNFRAVVAEVRPCASTPDTEPALHGQDALTDEPTPQKGTRRCTR